MRQPRKPLMRPELDLRLELHGAALVVIDGVNEAMAAASLDPNKNADVARWYTTIPRLATEAGATLITIDHVAKDPQSQRGAVGRAHKIAGIDGAAYKVEVVVPFGRGSRGIVKLRLEKDRPGWIRGSHPGKSPIVAEIAFDATDPDGAIVSSVRAPANGGSDVPWRPTALMERISTFLEELAEPTSQRQILDAINGKREYKIQAASALGAASSPPWTSWSDPLLLSEALPGVSGVSVPHRSPTVPREHSSDRSPVPLPYRGTVAKHSTTVRIGRLFPFVDGGRSCRVRTLELGRPVPCRRVMIVRVLPTSALAYVRGDSGELREVSWDRAAGGGAHARRSASAPTATPSHRSWSCRRARRSSCFARTGGGRREPDEVKRPPAS